MQCNCRCGCNHREPMGIRLDFGIVDESTARTILTNLRAAGVDHLYFPETPYYRTSLGRMEFIDPSFVAASAMSMRLRGG